MREHMCVYVCVCVFGGLVLFQPQLSKPQPHQDQGGGRLWGRWQFGKWGSL